MNETLAINYLRFWYNASNVQSLASSSFISFPDFIQGLRDTNPGFLAQLSTDLSTIRQDKVKRAFEALAASEPNTVPKANEFYGALATEMSSVNPANIADAVIGGVEDTAKQVGAVAALGLGSYAFILAIPFLIFAITQMKSLRRAL